MKASTIDEYISAQGDVARPVLAKVRTAIKEAIPDAEERIAWNMPTFWKKKNIIHFAAHKNHLGLYPGAEAIEHFKERLASYQTSKGAVQFQYAEPVPLDVVREMAQWCYSHKQQEKA